MRHVFRATRIGWDRKQDGVQYHDFYYLGLYDDDDMPQNNEDFINHLLKEKH
jgi:hypothetical protein